MTQLGDGTRSAVLERPAADSGLVGSMARSGSVARSGLVTVTSPITRVRRCAAGLAIFAAVMVVVLGAQALLFGPGGGRELQVLTVCAYLAGGAWGLRCALAARTKRAFPDR